MKLLMFVLGVLLGTAAIGTSAMAQNYPWCAHYGGLGGTNCGFTTYEQCAATVSGMGGSCMQNTQYAPAARRPASPPAAATSHQAQQKTHQNLVAPQPQ
jgi:biotin synthase-related radical SAM superfamily protein